MTARFTALFVLGAVLYTWAQGATGGMNIPRGEDLPTTCIVGAIYYKTDTDAGLYACSAANTWTSTSGESASVPAGSILLVASGTCPTAYTEVSALNGKTLIGTLNANADVGGTGGADSVTPNAHSETAVTEHASHTHTYTDVLNHTHTVNVTDPGHNHTQNAHNHVVTSQTATTGSATSYEHGVLDTSSAEAEATEVTASTTATNIANTTGITAATVNPAGGVASGTTAGPSATLTHSVTQPATHAALDNRSAFVKVIFCSKD